jgi:predicted RNA binding protein YcfA (HicA-like mRNA interferase family)
MSEKLPRVTANDMIKIVEKLGFLKAIRQP